MLQATSVASSYEKIPRHALQVRGFPSRSRRRKAGQHAQKDPLRETVLGCGMCSEEVMRAIERLPAPDEIEIEALLTPTYDAMIVILVSRVDAARAKQKYINRKSERVLNPCPVPAGTKGCVDNCCPAARPRSQFQQALVKASPD